MPSLRLYDGKLNVIMRKLNDMNIKIVEYSSVLAAIGQQVRTIQQVCSQPASSCMTAPLPRPDVGGDSNRTFRSQHRRIVDRKCLVIVKVVLTGRQ